MKIATNASFSRDAKKLPDSILDELKTIYEAIGEAESLDSLSYSVRKLAGNKKLKAFRL